MNLKQSPITKTYSVIDDFYTLDDKKYAVCTQSGYFKATGMETIDERFECVYDDDGNLWTPIYLTDGQFELMFSSALNLWAIFNSDGGVIYKAEKDEFQKTLQEYMRLIND